MTRLGTTLAVVALLAGCSDDKYVVVHVDARGAVHDATKLVITLGNAGTTLTRELALGSHVFPVAFSIDAPDRSGELDITVDAADATGTAVGHGSASSTIGAGPVDVLLDSLDFTVNTDFAMDQYLTFDYDSNGVQVATASDGTWTVGFRDNCNGSGMCNVYGRRFDARGAPAQSKAGAGTNQFTLTSALTDVFTDPAIASNGNGSIALWNHTDTGGSNGHSVACRPVSATGDTGANELTLSIDPGAIIAAAPLSNLNYAVVWELGFGIPASSSIRTVVATPDCTPVTSTLVTVSQSQGTTNGPVSPHVASNNGIVLYAWIVDGNVYLRVGNNAALFAGPEVRAINKTGTQTAATLRLATVGNGFALVVRWVDPTMATAPGKIEMFQANNMGVLVGAPILITDQSRSDFLSGQQAPSIATGGDGSMLVAWHVCDATGSIGSCDVFGRMVSPTFTLASDVFPLSSTTSGDQFTPAVAALPASGGAFVAVWTDNSHVGPDTQGSAVHARIVYPPGMSQSGSSSAR